MWGVNLSTGVRNQGVEEETSLCVFESRPGREGNGEMALFQLLSTLQQKNLPRQGNYEVGGALVVGLTPVYLAELL